MKSIFTGKVMETQWVITSGFKLFGREEWKSVEEFSYYSLGRRPTAFYRIIDREEIHSNELDYAMRVGDFYFNNDEKYQIEQIEFNSDNSITYHTDYVVSNKELNSLDEILDEFFEEREQERELTGGYVPESNVAKDDEVPIIPYIILMLVFSSIVIYLMIKFIFV